MMPRRPLRSLSAPRAATAAVLAAASLLVALDLARPYAGPGLRPWQWAAGLLAVAVVAAALHGREGGLRTHWPAVALATLLIPTYVDHTRRIEIGDPVHYYSSLRSVLFDGDLRLANDYEILGWGGHEGENAQPIGAPLLWSPFVVLVHLGREAARLFGLPAPEGTEPIYAAAVALATFVYGVAGLFVLMAALRRFVPPAAAFWTTVLCWVGFAAALLPVRHARDGARSGVLRGGVDPLDLPAAARGDRARANGSGRGVVRSGLRPRLPRPFAGRPPPAAARPRARPAAAAIDGTACGVARGGVAGSRVRDHRAAPGPGLASHVRAAPARAARAAAWLLLHEPRPPAPARRAGRRARRPLRHPPAAAGRGGGPGAVCCDGIRGTSPASRPSSWPCGTSTPASSTGITCAATPASFPCSRPAWPC